MAFNGTTNNNVNNNNNNDNASNNTEGESDGTNKKKNLIIVVEKDSQDKLDELFNKALSNKVPLQVPLRMRKLPDSFFNPPSSGSKSPSVSVSHSRENSADSAFGSGTTILGGVTSINGLPIHHSRAQSSPASLGIGINLPLGLSTGTPGTNPSTNPTTKLQAGNALNNNNATNASNNLAPTATQKGFPNLHSRGRSYDVTNLHAHFGSMPEGWEQAKTDDGRIYYIK